MDPNNGRLVGSWPFRVIISSMKSPALAGLLFVEIMTLEGH